MSPRRTLTASILAACVAFCAGCNSMESARQPDEQSAARGADPLIVATYYTARLDTRRCAFPRCGGVFVSAANRADTSCEDGTSATECYAATLDVSGLDMLPGAEGVLRDAMSARHETTRVVLFGDLATGPTGFATLVVRNAWIAPQSTALRGDFTRVVNNGIVCVAAPCPSFDQETINFGVVNQIHGVRLTEMPGTDEDRGNASQSLFSRSGIIAVGENVVDENAGPAGPGTFLEAKQVFLPISPRRR